MLHRAYQSWHEATLRSHYAGYNFAQENFLSQKTLQMLVSMKHQFLELLSSIGFAPNGITMRSLTRMSRNGSDGVAKATGNLEKIINLFLNDLNLNLETSLERFEQTFVSYTIELFFENMKVGNIH